MVRGREVPWGALAAVAIWGAAFVFVRIALARFDPLDLVLLRTAIGCVSLGLVTLARRGPLLPEREDRPRAALLGLLLAAHLGIQTTGLQYTTAIHAGWLVGFSSVLIAVGAQLVLRQPLTGTGWSGVAVAVAGIALVTGFTPGEFAQARKGDLLQLAACFTWTAYTLIGARAMRRSGPLAVTSFAMAVAAVALFAAVLLLDRPEARAVDARTASYAWIALAYLGFVSSGLAFTLWLGSQRKHGTQKVGAMLYFEPLFTLAVARLLLEEPFGLPGVAGGLLVLFGVWLVGRGARRPA